MINERLYNYNELPLFNFIQCIIYGNYKFLVKSKGFIKRSKLKKHWESIFSEYLEKSGDNSNIFLLSSTKEYAILLNKINLIDDCIEMMSTGGYNKDLALLLKNVGYPLSKTNDNEKFIKSLKSIQSRAKLLVLRANKIKSDLDKFKENSGSESIKEQDFTELLIMLSKIQGYQITSKNTTVDEFVLLLNINSKKDKNGR